MFDKDRDGQISMPEVRQVVMAMGQTPNDERIEALFKQVDLDGNGLIDYDEFVRLVEERVRAQPDDTEMRAMFEAFDKDKNGYIDKQELMTTFAEIELPVSEQEVADMMRAADIQDGRIFFEGDEGHIAVLLVPVLWLCSVAVMWLFVVCGFSTVELRQRASRLDVGRCYVTLRR